MTSFLKDGTQVHGACIGQQRCVGLSIDYKLHNFKLLISRAEEPEPMRVCEDTLTNASFVDVGFLNG